MKSLEELKAIKEKMQGQVEFRSEDGVWTEDNPYRKHVLVCGGTGCTSSGSKKIIEKLHEEIRKNSLENEIGVVKTGCFGLCALGPIMIVYPEGAFYSMVKEEDIPEIVSEHLLNGRIVTRLLYQETVSEDGILPLQETEFYKKQKRIALRNCGVINPENIEEYIGTSGYEALGKVLTTMTPDDVIQVILDSGLRGRGGAGFPTGLKWKFAKGNQADQKYVCCNADEGDPGAFMDRSVLEGDPHVVLEAMTIAGYAIGASQGYIYVRAEYPMSVSRLRHAIAEMENRNLLGDNILGTDFCFHMHINRGAGAFVCGEGSALTASIEGKRGMPRVKPPRTVEKGLWEKPTVLNNVETFANVPKIILQGADWYRSIGTAGSPGTKTFSLTGAIENTGLIEVPMGSTLREIIYDIGGGLKEGSQFKAVQIGGPSGGCLTEKHLDEPLDFDSVKKFDAIVGSGGMVVMDQHTCMVEVARFFMNFTQNESCGKCVPCREGTKRMLEILEKIVEGRGEEEDLDRLEELAAMIRSMALCGLGKSAPLPVISTLKLFRNEYLEHINEHKCAAKVCQAMRKYVINPEFCKGCSKCAKNCPVGAISGKVKHPFHIDPNICIKCGACKENCAFNAIYIEE